MYQHLCVGWNKASLLRSNDGAATWQQVLIFPACLLGTRAQHPVSIHNVCPSNTYWGPQFWIVSHIAPIKSSGEITYLGGFSDFSIKSFPGSALRIDIFISRSGGIAWSGLLRKEIFSKRFQQPRTEPFLCLALSWAGMKGSRSVQWVSSSFSLGRD